MSSEDAQATPVTDLSAVMEAVEALKKSLEEQRKGHAGFVNSAGRCAAAGEKRLVTTTRFRVW